MGEADEGRGEGGEECGGTRVASSEEAFTDGYGAVTVSGGRHEVLGGACVTGSGPVSQALAKATGPTARRDAEMSGATLRSVEEGRGGPGGGVEREGRERGMAGEGGGRFMGMERGDAEVEEAEAGQCSSGKGVGGARSWQR